MKDFFSKCDQIRTFLRIWSHLLKKSFMENFIFRAVFLTISFDAFVGLPQNFKAVLSSTLKLLNLSQYHPLENVFLFSSL